MGRNNQGKRQQRQPVQIPVTKQTFYTGCQINVQKLDDGSRQLHIIDPATGTVHIFPLSAEAAREIGNALFSAVPIAGADQMPRGEAA